MSNIKITVDWADSAVFAGDEVACIITFQNVAPAPVRTRIPSSSASTRALEPRRRLREPEISRQRAVPSRNPSLARGNVESARLATLPLATGASVQQSQSRQDRSSKPNAKKHGRSVSIISMGPNTQLSGPTGRTAARTYSPYDRISHARAASFQGVSNSTVSSSTGGTLASSWLPAHPASSNVSKQLDQLSFEQGETLHAGQVPLSSERGSQNPTGESQLNGHTREEDGENFGADRPQGAPHALSLPLRPIRQMSQNPRPLHDTGDRFNSNDNGNSSSKAVSPVSTNPTPRSSLEFYSQSNHSNETLASEYVLPVSTNRVASGSRFNHETTSSTSPIPYAPAETLMMGYVQLNGSFILDGSLINLIPFEPIKKKGVIGGQGGGGVVGIRSTKRDSSLLGSLGWSNISQSLGGLVGGQEPSSMREMKGIASAQAVPIISTPQSILFVDLKLRAGEIRRFRYRHRLPQVLPPSCKGRAIKITYQLTIGVQRPHSTTKSQHLSHVNVPFKVLPSVRANGSVPVYNLKSPHIILQNSADLQLLSSDLSMLGERLLEDSNTVPGSDGSLSSFVCHLLGEPLEGVNHPSLSSTELPTPMNVAVKDHPTSSSMNNLIDAYIFQGDPLAASKAATNRFDIHRLGQRVATIMLARSAYKLGETIITSVDFREGYVPCFSLHAHLETSEEVEETLALRSNASILRATRRIHASHFESTLCARRIIGRFIIPSGATPDFKTSGVSLGWALRFEFTTKSRNSADENVVFDEITVDERGKVLAAAQELQTESFEVSIPLRVFGAIDSSTNNNPSSFIV